MRKMSIWIAISLAWFGCSNFESAPRVETMPRAHAGTEPDGAWMLDRSGVWLWSEETRRRFEWFWLAAGQDGAQTLDARVFNDLLNELGPSNAELGRDDWLRYRSFRASVLSFVGTPAVSGLSQDEILAGIREQAHGLLRREQAEEVLSSWRHLETRSRGSERSREYDARRSLEDLDREAITRVQDLKKRRQAFRRKVEDYRVARAGLSEDDAALLRKTWFGKHERIRVEAWERMDWSPLR